MMSYIELDKNKVLVSGYLSDFKKDKDCYNNRLCRGFINIIRLSEKVDRIPITIPEYLLDDSIDYNNLFVEVEGEYRTYNKDRRLYQYIYATSIDFCDSENNAINEIHLTGHVCKPPVLRETPKSKKEITDIFLAVNAKYGKSYYIPCICWGINAEYASYLSVGSKIEVKGRVQSREYVKKVNETEYETREAYEVSIKEIFEEKANA